MILEIRKKNFTNPASLFNLLFRFGYDDENMKALVGPHYNTSYFVYQTPKCSFSVFLSGYFV